MSIERGRQAGLSLIELIIFIVVVSAGLVGILSVMNITTKSSADPQIRKQAIAIAESLLEEIMLKDYSDPDGVTGEASRDLYDDVDDYAAYSANPAVDVSGVALPTTGTFSANVSVAPHAALADIKVVTVTVSGSGESIALAAYRGKF